MTAQRSPFTIHRAVLQAALEGQVLTRIKNGAGLNHNIAVKYVSRLQKLGLIETTEDQKWRTTDAGRKLLAQLDQILAQLDQMHEIPGGEDL